MVWMRRERERKREGMKFTTERLYGEVERDNEEHHIRRERERERERERKERERDFFFLEVFRKVEYVSY